MCTKEFHYEKVWVCVHPGWAAKVTKRRKILHKKYGCVCTHTFFSGSLTLMTSHSLANLDFQVKFGIYLYIRCIDKVMKFQENRLEIDGETSSRMVVWVHLHP